VSEKKVDEKKSADAFRTKLSIGIEMKKFATSSRFRAKPSSRILWLDSRSQTLYWQKGLKKNVSKIKNDASIRLSDIVRIGKGCMATATLQKHGNEEKNDLYLSLIGRGNSRTLDMEIVSMKLRNELVYGFELLLGGK